MSPIHPSYSTTEVPKYPDIPETQEKHLKINCMKMIEILKEEIDKCLLKIHENTKYWRRQINASKLARKTQIKNREIKKSSLRSQEN